MTFECSFAIIKLDQTGQEKGVSRLNWKDYKDHVREVDPEIAKDVDEIEVLSQIVGTMIEQRHHLNLTQRELAELCGLPHSSIARIESGKTTPNLSTLLKIFRKLGITLVAEPVTATHSTV